MPPNPEIRASSVESREEGVAKRRLGERRDAPWHLTAIGLVLLLATPAFAGGAEIPFEPALEIGPCEHEGFDRSLECGTLTVPEDWSRPEGRTIPLNLVLLPARDGSDREDSVLYLVGGPGGAATESLPFLAVNLGALQETHDLVLVDQRGTGKSNRLGCSLSFSETLDALFAARFSRTSLEKCLETLAADPTDYTSTATADDFDAVRAALGYEQVDLVGISYGSRLALVYLRRYPERVRALALRGVASPSGNLLLDISSASDRAFELLLARCASEPACVASSPDFAGKLERVFERLSQRPLKVDVERPGGQRESLTITRDLAAGMLRQMLASDRSAALIPKLVEDADRGIWDLWTRLLERGVGPDPDAVSIGLYLSVVCAEDMAFLDREAAKTSARGLFLTPSVIDNLARACETWPHATLPADFKRPVASDVPALLMSGSADPATAPDVAQEVARHLGDSRHLVTPGLAHFPTWTNCFARNTALLVASGSLEAIDVACASDYEHAGFKSPPPGTTSARFSWSAFFALGAASAVLLITLMRRALLGPRSP